MIDLAATRKQYLREINAKNNIIASRIQTVRENIFKKNTRVMIDRIERQSKNNMTEGSYYIKCPDVLPESVTKETLDYSSRKLEELHENYYKNGLRSNMKCDQSMLDHVNEMMGEKIVNYKIRTNDRCVIIDTE
jgi:membrane-associated HD superfamily phosphohydrolase